MILPGFLVFLLFVSAVPLFTSLRYHIRPEKTFLPGLLTNALLFYFFSACGIMQTGFYLIFAVNLLLYVPTVRILFHEPDLLRKEFFRIPVIVFYAVLSALFLLTRSCVFLFWDEYSHWGVAPRLLFETGLLNCAWGSLLEHASYVPGLAVFDIMVHKCFLFVPFQESLVIFAVWFLILSAVFHVLGDLKEEGNTYDVYLLGFLAVLLELLCFFFRSFLTCESDPVLAVFFALAVYAVLRNKNTIGDNWTIALLLIWLILIKSAGNGFAVLTIILYIVTRIRNICKSRKWSGWLLTAFVIAVPFLVKATWSFQLRYWGTRIVFSPGKITLSGICDLIFHGKPDYAAEVAGNWGMAFLFPLFLFLLIYFLHYLYGKKAESFPDLFWFLPFSFILFSVMLFFTYIFIFNEFQALRLVSFSRYMNGFLLMPYLVLTFLFFSGGRLFAVKEKTRKRIFRGVIILFFGMYAGKAVIYCRPYYREYREIHESEEKYGNLLREKGNTFHLITAKGGGQRAYMMRYLFPENFRKEINPVLKDLPEVAYTEEVFSPQELCARFREVRFVLIDYPPENLLRDYGEIFVEKAEKLNCRTLYEVQPDGRLLLNDPARYDNLLCK